jgi:hypothetical protein
LVCGRLNALQRVEELNALIRSRQGRRDARRNWLHRQLLDIWQNHFGGRLAVSTAPITHEPGGPLIRFLAVALAAADEPVNVFSIRTAVERERRRRRMAVSTTKN